MANLASAVTTLPGVQINPISLGPTVTSVVATGSGITAGAGDIGVGQTVTLTLKMNGAVAVTGGTPTLSLNDGGTATYTGGSGSNALTFNYTAGPGQNTADLAVTAVNLNGAAVTTNLPTTGRPETANRLPMRTVMFGPLVQRRTATDPLFYAMVFPTPAVMGPYSAKM